MPLEILYQDDYLIAVNKPHGLLVHPTSIARDANSSVLSELKKITDQYYYTIHRLDRKTSGVLLLALDKKVQSELSKQFREGKIRKSYHAIVRGYTDDHGVIDYAIKNDKGKTKEAITNYKTLERFEIDYPTAGHKSSRYSLVELQPETGRYHQLRMHMAHIMHPIIGDRPHGCNKQNRFFKHEFDMIKMMLHAISITFKHPITNESVQIYANYSSDINTILGILKRGI